MSNKTGSSRDKTSDVRGVRVIEGHLTQENIIMWKKYKIYDVSIVHCSFIYIWSVQRQPIFTE